MLLDCDNDPAGGNDAGCGGVGNEVGGGALADEPTLAGQPVSYGPCLWSYTPPRSLPTAPELKGSVRNAVQLDAVLFDVHGVGVHNVHGAHGVDDVHGVL